MNINAERTITANHSNHFILENEMENSKSILKINV